MKDLNRMMFVEIGQRSNCIIGLDQIFLRVACSRKRNVDVNINLFQSIFIRRINLVNLTNRVDKQNR